MNSYTIKYGESIFDVSTKIYGNINNVFYLILLNPILDNVNNTNITGLTINYVDIPQSRFITKTNEIFKPQKSVTIKENQSIFDVSLQIYGNIEQVFDIVNNSEIDNINETEIKGITYKYDYNNTKFVNYFSSKKVVITTLRKVTTEGIIDGNFVWDGTYIIWDGSNSLVY